MREQFQAFTHGPAYALSSLMSALRFALRQLRKTPGFTVTTLITLGLGIGATTAIFTLVNAVVLRPLPFPDSDRLIWAHKKDTTPGAIARNEPVSYPDFFDYRAQSRSFAGMTCYHGGSFTLTGHGDAQLLSGEVVSSEFFRVLGVAPMLGRDFRLEEEKAGSRVVVLSYGLWRTTFGSARDIAGQAITVNGQPYTVAGVMPRGFSFPIQRPEPVFWTTLAEDATGKDPQTEQRGNDRLDVTARLKPGVSVAQARAELNTIARNLAAQYPDSDKRYTAAAVESQLDRLVGDTRPALRLLLGAVGLVLLIACVNVAGLLLGRTSARRTEIALRAALGARRGTLLRQILLESLLLSGCGGILGVLFSSWILAALLRFVPQNLPRLNEISVDGPVLIFATAVSVFTGLLFGVLPAWRASKTDPLQALREGSRSVTAGRGQHRLHGWLVIGETALGLMLLTGSGLLIRSFVQVLQVDPGFDPQHVLTGALNLPEARYTDDQQIQFYKTLLSRLRELPGVRSVSAAAPLPLSGGSLGVSIQIGGHPLPPGDQPDEQLAVISPGFFETVGIPIRSGRDFTWADDHRGKPVIIVNEAFAKKYFPNENPIGRHVQAALGDGVMEQPMREVVGVVGDVKRKGLTTVAEPIYYLPWSQAVITSPQVCIRTAGDPTSMAGALRAQVASLDPNLPLYRVATMEDYVYRAAAQPRFYAVLLTAFAVLAVILSAVGLYAVLSYLVVQRTGEIGVRMALGAQRSDVLQSILGRGLGMAAAGIVIGLAGSALLMRLLRDMLFRVQPYDPATMVTVTGVFLLVALIACSAPAYRATRLDPMNTLRDQ